MKKIREFVFIIAAAAALVLGVREPALVEAQQIVSCWNWTYHCDGFYVACQQMADGSTRYCYYQSCSWHYVAGTCSGQAGTLYGF